MTCCMTIIVVVSCMRCNGPTLSETTNLKCLERSDQLSGIKCPSLPVLASELCSSVVVRSQTNYTAEKKKKSK